MSIIADWERQEFNKWDKQRSKEDDYNRAVEMEIEAIKEDIANGDDDASVRLAKRCLMMTNF